MTVLGTPHVAASRARPLHGAAMFEVMALRRRIINTALLVLALLGSQQAAMLHTASHLSQAARATADVLTKPIKPVFEDKLCVTCLAQAQFISFLNGMHLSWVGAKAPSLRIVLLAPASASLLPVFVFQPRAPPLA